jgi:RNA-directed DNA polymerase
MKTHFEIVQSKTQLWRAWQIIRANGFSSRSRQTQIEIRNFDERAPMEINRLSAQLSSKRVFQFSKSTGITQKKKAGGRRPIVLSPVRNRIVQRSILDTLQDDANLQDLFDAATSYGGIKEKGVKDAVLRAFEEVQSGKAKFYITSDIAGFFNDINRHKVTNALNNRISDPKFQTLFANALNTELENMAELQKSDRHELFPIYEIGVAQGCCLSPFAGNIFLREFDSRMNDSELLCLRYIDDFIILGPTEKDVRKKFNEAVSLLKSLGLSAYEPSAESDKAKAGPVEKGFDYLGCSINPHNVRPSKKSWNRLHREISDSFGFTLQAIDAPSQPFQENRLSFTDCIVQNSRKLESWAKQYKFCTDKRVMKQWNGVLLDEFHNFEVTYFKLLKGKSSKDRARLIGWQDIEQFYVDASI